MPPQLPNNQQRSPRHRAVAVITRAQEDAMRRLRQAGIPETSALMVMQRIASFGVQTLRELDALYRQFDDIIAEDGRNAAHQEWVDNKAAALLLQLESAIAILVAEIIRQATDELKTQPPPAGQVIEPGVASQLLPPPAGLPFLLALLMHCIWVAGMAASLLFAYQASGMLFWAGIGLMIPFLLWYRWGSAWWSLFFPLTALGAEAWVLFWLLIVEG
jgi:hypothetical protein